MLVKVRKLSTTVKTKEFRVTALAVYRHILKEERYSRAQAKSCRNSKEWKDLVGAYNADADDYKKLAGLVKAEEWRKAFTFYQGLDTYVREGIPTHHAAFMAQKVIAGHEKRKAK
jgi:hypothetical protein